MTSRISEDHGQQHKQQESQFESGLAADVPLVDSVSCGAFDRAGEVVKEHSVDAGCAVVDGRSKAIRAAAVAIRASVEQSIGVCASGTDVPAVAG